MSSAEIDLGAHLYIRAIEEKIPETIKSNPLDYSAFQLAFRDMSRWLVKRGALTKNDQDAWVADSAAIAAIDEKEAAGFLPYYQTVVMAHTKSDAALIRDGKAEYLKEFRELHADTIFDIEPETLTRVRGGDMQAIASGALNLLEAVHNDPANAAFVSGLDRASLDSLWSVLETSGYLMPGQNPDRSAPLGDQPLRGTPEEMDTLVHQASQISANLNLPEVVNQGDKPMTAAMLFKRAIDGAHYETVEVSDRGPDMNFDSDLTNIDCGSIYNVAGAFVRLAHSAQWDTQSIGALMVERGRVDDMRIALEDYYDKSINHCLMSGNMGDPKIDPEQAVRLGRAIDWMNEAISTDMKNERFTGDDGGLDVMGGKTKAMNRDFEEDIVEEAPIDAGFDDAVDEAEHETAEDKAAKDTGRGTVAAPVVFDADADLGAELYGHSDEKVRIPEALIYEADMIMLEMLDNGTIEYLRVRDGRPEIDMGDVDSSRAAFGTLEEAMGQFRDTFTNDGTQFGPGRVVTRAERASMHPDRQARLNLARIEPGRDIFRDYKPGSPQVAGKRMTRYLDRIMLQEDGSPNYNARRWLRDVAEKGVECEYRGEGEAAFAYAEAFVARDRKEIEQRQDSAREKRGISRVDFSAEEIGKFLFVKEASGTPPHVQITIAADGSVALSDPDAPKVTSKLTQTAPNLEQALAKKAANAPRLGGMISTEALKAAYQTGAKEISVMIDGDNPYAAIGKMTEEPVRKKTRVEQLVLS